MKMYRVVRLDINYEPVEEWRSDLLFMDKESADAKANLLNKRAYELELLGYGKHFDFKVWEQTITDARARD